MIDRRILRGFPFEKSREADLVLLRANPLRDIHNLETIGAVVFRGNVLDRAQLDRMLEQLEQEAANWPQ